MANETHNTISVRSLERLLMYRRLLHDVAARGGTHLFSHELAAMANNSAAQVRRDLMVLGYTGNPHSGYSVEELLKRINRFLRKKEDRKVGLVGVGHLGRAILSFFSGRDSHQRIVAAFDSNPAKIGKHFSGIGCVPVDHLAPVVKKQAITLGIITVPAQAAQHVADLLVLSGIRGILNFAPVPVIAPAKVLIEQVDMTAKLEKLAFFCR